MYINNNYILDTSIYNKEFNIKLFYEIKNDYVLFVKNGYDVKFKINKPLYNKISINNIETTNVNLTKLLSKIVDNFYNNISDLFFTSVDVKEIKMWNTTYAQSDMAICDGGGYSKKLKLYFENLILFHLK